MKVNIIGAGIAGLSAGCYLQMNGYETEIFEKHSKSGGLCTSWKVGGYTFDGCLHWLLGSGPANPFYLLWSELIDMKTVGFIHHEVRVEIEVKDYADKYGSKIFKLYNDLNKLEAYLLDIAPEDRSRIKKLIRSVRKLQTYEIPPMIGTFPPLFTMKQKMGMIQHLPLLLNMLRNRYVTNFTLLKQFKNPFLREALSLLYDGDENPILITTIPLAFADRKSTGYPVGGSSLIANRIAERYLSLGGKINYHSGVKEIITLDHTATGVKLEDGREINSDITISAADWHYTVFDALKGKYTNPVILGLNEQTDFKVYYSVLAVFLGFSRTFEGFSHFSRFPIEKELTSPDGTHYSRLELHIHNYDPALVQDGKTSVSVSFYTQKGDFWIDLYKNDREQYDRLKETFAKEVVNILEAKFGSMQEHLEVVSVATPATYHRYTSNWKGSVQGWLPGKNIMKSSPVGFELPGLKQFYFAGHWTQPGGGLPVAIKSARDAVQMICRRTGRGFTTTSFEK
ncbi:MAG: NAD(P)/FAD-dependent oxidoreductase [Bacteroidota bacterium]